MTHLHVTKGINKKFFQSRLNHIHADPKPLYTHISYNNEIHSYILGKGVGYNHHVGIYLPIYKILTDPNLNYQKRGQKIDTITYNMYNWFKDAGGKPNHIYGIGIDGTIGVTSDDLQKRLKL